MTPQDFQLRFKARAPQLMWLLGAGASASAGIKTAGQMIWEFKRTIYCLEKKVSESRVPTMLDSSTRLQIQAALDQTKRFPAADTVEEYSAYFEVARPTQADRRQYIQEQVRQGTPSRGHIGLAALLRTGRSKLVWTTNFDAMVEKAYDGLKNFSLNSNDLLNVSLTNAEEARRGLNENNYPMLVKLHGDYQSVKLMNTTNELKSQDEKMRLALTRACGQYGLIVVGYSGRDDSVMDALQAALDDPENFPGGIFWIIRSGSRPYSRVTEFIDTASSIGIDANFVEIDTFDELVSDLIRLESSEMSVELNDYLQQIQPPLTDASIPPPGSAWPLLRMNALLISRFPNTCRLVRVERNFEGDHMVQPLVEASNNSVLARRFRGGIMSFGADKDIKTTFASCISGGLDYHPFQKISTPSSYESQEHRLVMDAFARAIVREGYLRLERRFGAPLLIEMSDEHPQHFAGLQAGIPGGKLSGEVNGYKWHEALELHIESRLDRLWLIIVPTVWIDAPPADEDYMSFIGGAPPISAEYAKAREFTRQRLFMRRNEAWGGMISGWIHVLLNGAQNHIFKTFDLHEDGSDAVFILEKETAHSRRAN
jgi:NAD-dependent SIR2 family protein deacetylase